MSELDRRLRQIWDARKQITRIRDHLDVNDDLPLCVLEQLTERLHGTYYPWSVALPNRFSAIKAGHGEPVERTYHRLTDHLGLPDYREATIRGFADRVRTSGALIILPSSGQVHPASVRAYDEAYRAYEQRVRH